MRNEKKIRKDLVTPPGEYEDRDLHPAKKRASTRCVRCGSARCRILQKPDLYICVICKKKFIKEN